MSSTSEAPKSRVLYLMHVDWRWPRQRPHWIAESLHSDAEDLVVRVAYLPSWRRRLLSDNPSLVHNRPIPQLPLARIAQIAHGNRRLVRWWLSRLVRRWRPDVIVVPYPTLGDLLPASPVPVVYDCMDLAEGFAASKEEAEQLRDSEGRLLQRAAACIASSEYLRRHLVSRGARSVSVVRNGVTTLPRHEQRPPHAGVDLGYFGAISAWFDFPTLLTVIEAVPELTVHLWGPADAAIPEHPRLQHHGTVPHRQIAELMQRLDALVMPFVVTPLIEGVDPVKVYEYVASGRPSLVVDYAELSHFGELIHRYRDAEHLRSLVEQVRDRPEEMAPPATAAEDFLRQSTWSARGRAYASILREAAHGPRVPRPG